MSEEGEFYETYRLSVGAVFVCKRFSEWFRW